MITKEVSSKTIVRPGMAKREAYLRSIEVLEKCATPHGFHAAFPGYDAVWSRDSMITSLGASLLDNKFETPFRQSIITLAKNQSPSGQIPNAVDAWSERKAHVDFQSIDSTLWFLIGLKTYEQRFKDRSLTNQLKKQIDKAFAYLAAQDSAEVGMLTQQPTSDWQDAFPHRYGHTINTQALYYKALTLYGKNKEAARTKNAVNKNEDKGLWNGEFYLPWRWKNHNAYQEKGEWFDSLGNVLAILFDLADKPQAEKILSHIEKNKIAQPYPIRAIDPPITRESKDWHDYFDDCNARDAYSYLNGGIWTFIGSFYVLALIKYKRFAEAEHALEKVAEANMLAGGNFSEWLHGKTGEPALDGGNQAWNAGTFVLAYNSLQKKKVLLP